ncbi:MAG: prolyl oligopeptidase family serine peptidase [Bacteroidales bacterium]|nr:prolyl oligopeptidase family serine peptidase [Bacteroidales bacterium]
MKKLTLILILFLSSASVYAQNYITIQGKITDQNKTPLEYASIGIIGTTIGTVSNTEGVFIFKIPKKYKDKTLKISMLGYESFSIIVSNIKSNIINIQLPEKTYKISEVEVKPKDAKEIVRKAIEKIPINYPAKAINMDGFYREMTFENDTCVELAEAAYETYYRPYTDTYHWKEARDNYFSKGNFNRDEYFFFLFNPAWEINPHDRIKITESRASNLHHKHRFKVIPFGGPSGIIGYDWIKHRVSFKNGDFLKKHKFKLLGINEYDGKRVYKISAEPKLFTKTYHYILYIDFETHAFAKIEYYFPGIEFETNYYWTPALYKKRKRKCEDTRQHLYYKAVTNYKKIENKWYLNYIKQQSSFEYIFSKHYIYKKTQDKIKYNLQSELLINNIKTKDVKNIPDSTVFKNTFFNALYEYDLDYNRSFWESYNTIATTHVQDSIIKQLEKHQSIEQQFSEKFIKDDSLKAPIAKKIPFVNSNTNITDNYYWMQDLKNPEVLKYVEKENHYTKNFMLSLKKTKRNLFYEMIKRYEKNTAQIFRKKKNGEYEYYYKQEKGANYPNIYRKKIGKNTEEELILDVNKKAQYHPSYWAEITSISPDNSIFVYTEPITDGYDSRIILKNLNTGKNIDSLYKAGDIIWTKNKDEFLYTTWDETNRVDKLFKHKIGSEQINDELIYYEKNKLNNISLSLHDKKYLLLESSNDFYYNDVYLIKLSGKEIKLNKVADYKDGFSHFIKIKSDTLYSLTNEPGGKTVLYYSDITNSEQKNWEKIIQNTDNAFFADYMIFKKYIILIEKENMQSRFRIIDKKGKTIKILEFIEEETYSVGFKYKEDLPENTFRFYYTSLATPKKIYEYDIEKDVKIFINQEEIKGYIAKNYTTKLLWANSKDGVKVPLSIVYNKKRVKRNGKAPVLLTAYGSYGGSQYPTFSLIRLSLLDRGFIYAIAHVRGGSELGKKWHEDAMQLKKKNTFYDFIACAEHLIKEKYTSKGNIVAQGGSAGGLTMGVAANWKPELFNTIILNAPYIDILNTLTDTTAKFNSVEKGQLGDPEKKEAFKYIKSYSPYGNIAAQNYPNMLFTAGLNDTRVAYWHAVKSVAKLRALKTNNNTLLLKTDLYAGHNSYSGKYNFINFDAFIYAFILNNMGIKY